MAIFRRRQQSKTLKQIESVVGRYLEEIPHASRKDGCPEYEVFAAYVDGALAEDASTNLHEHLDQCEACAYLLARLQHWAKGKAFPQTPRSYLRQARGLAPREGSWNWQKISFAVAGCLVFCLLIGMGLLSTSHKYQLAKRPQQEYDEAIGRTRELPAAVPETELPAAPAASAPVQETTTFAKPLSDLIPAPAPSPPLSKETMLGFEITAKEKAEKDRGERDEALMLQVNEEIKSERRQDAYEADRNANETLRTQEPDKLEQSQKPSDKIEIALRKPEGAKILASQLPSPELARDAVARPVRSLAVTFRYRSDETGEVHDLPLPLDATPLLAPKDGFGFTLRPERDGWVYVFRLDSKQDLSLVLKNPLNAGRAYFIPSDKTWYSIGDSGGIETIYIVFSPRQCQDWEGRFGEYQDKADSSVAQSLILELSELAASSPNIAAEARVCIVIQFQVEPSSSK